MKDHRILIADTQSYDTLPEMPGIFARGGCDVDVLCLKNSWLRRNRFYKTWIPREENSAQYAKQLIAIAKSDHYDWIVLGDDATNRLMNEYVGSDSHLFSKILPLSDIAHREILGSKIGFVNACNHLKIKIPKTIICTRQNIFSEIKNLTYPIVIKSDIGHSGSGIIKCLNDQNLDIAIKQFAHDEKFIIQEYIVGDIVNAESLFKKGKLFGYVYSKTIENNHHEFGVSTARAYLANDDIESILMEIGSKLKINGFVNMTFMRNNKGEHYLIEADVRPQAWFPLARFSGTDFSVAIKNFLENNDNIVRPIMKTGDVVIVRHFARDIIRCIIDHNGKGIVDWILNKDNRWRFIPWYDPVLTFWMFGRIVKFWIGLQI